jgi:FAD/FMN-containing dehydrogenase
MTNTDLLYKELSSIFPPERLSCDESVLFSYATDQSTPPGPATLPPMVVLPETTEEVKNLLVAANRCKVPVLAFSRGANKSGIGLPYKGEVVVDLRRMNKILEINTEGAYAVIEPGVTLHQLSLETRKHGFINHLPTASGGASALANYLMRPSGNLAAKWDPDPLISLEVVIPSGDIIRTGSAAYGTAGWRSRYVPFPDLTGLFALSYGTLGIITKGSVKLFDRGEEERLLVTKFDSFAPAAEYMKLIVRRNLADSVTFWNWTWNIFHELMVSKTHVLPAELMKEDQQTPPPGIPFGIASARLSGYKEVVEAQQNTCIRLARELGGEYMPEEEFKEVHPGTFAYLKSYFVDGLYIKPGEESTMREALWLSGCLVNVEPSKVVALEREMQEFAKREAKPPYMFRSLPFNHGREFFFAFVILIAGSLDEERDYMIHLRNSYRELYHELLSKYGTIMFRFRRDPTFLSLTGSYGELLRKIKTLIDPNNIMYPGIGIFSA